MENVVVTQAYLFLVYFISGMLIGVLFDVFRVLRKSFSTKDFVTYIEDILFWLFTGIFLLFVLFKFSNGEIRIYSIIGMIIGVVFYMLSISKFFIKINVTIITFIKNIIIYPVKLILKIINKIFSPFTFFVINIGKILKSSNTKLKNKLKNKENRRKIG